MMIVIGACTAITIRFELSERAEVAWFVLTARWHDVIWPDADTRSNRWRRLTSNLAELWWTDAAARFAGPLEEVFQHPDFTLGFSVENPGFSRLRLEYETGMVLDAVPSLDQAEFRSARAGRAWLTWIPRTSDPGLGAPISRCGNANNVARMPIRATRRTDGRVGVLVDVDGWQLTPVGKTWIIPSLIGLSP